MTNAHLTAVVRTWQMQSKFDSGIRIVGREVNRTIVGLEPVGGVHDMADTLYPSDHRFLYLDIDVSVDD